MSLSLHTLSFERRVGQLFCIGIPRPSVDDAAAELVKKVRPGGVCLFARNIREARQTRDLLDDLRDRCSPAPLLTLDQEGGLVDRLRKIITPMPAANLFRDAEQAGRFGAIVADTVRTLGFNMDFAPVVDVINEDRETVTNGLFSRAFGVSAEEAAQSAGAFLENLQAGGVLGCAKHFPGLGASSVDSHEELPQVPISQEDLRDVDLIPYQRLIERNLIHCIMVAHASFPNIGLQERAPDGKLLPSSLSGSFIDGLLRTDLKFDGLVITDDLEMGAIVKNYGIGEACVMAIEAGADMFAICADAGRVIEGYEAVANAVQAGRVSEDRLDLSLERIAAAKALLQEPLPFDTQRLAELSDSVERLNDELRSGSAA